MTRVLVLTDLYWPFPGGAERLIGNLARDLMRRGHDVHVFTGYETPQQFDGPPVSRADISLDADGWSMIDAMLAAYRPDVIVTHHLYANTFTGELATTGIPVVQLVLNGTRHPQFALAVAISEHVAAQVGMLPGDMVITPPVFDDVIADTHGDGIGFIKPIPHKGVDLVYRLARLLRGRRFVILRGEWQTLETIRVFRNVEFLEPVVDMRDFYRRCRLLLVPSLSEDAGTVAQEATVNGLACISSNVGGLPETNAGGILLDPEDVSGWLRAVRSLDDPGVYASRVASQRAGLAAQDHAGRLDELAARIEAL